MAKFYHWQGEGSDGNVYKGEYQFTAKDAKNDAIKHGMPQPDGFTIFETKVTDTATTLRNLLNQEMKIIGEIKPVG